MPATTSATPGPATGHASTAARQSRHVAGRPPAAQADPARALPEPARRGHRQHRAQHRPSDPRQGAARRHELVAVDRRLLHLCFAALLIPAGALGDRYGRRLSLIGGLVVFALGSLAAAFASSAGVLIADRVVMGLGAAFVMPATLSILNAVFPPRERAQAIAAWSAVAGVGIIIGPTLGGFLLAHFWWGSVFLVNVPIVAVALAGVLRIVPETAEAGRRSLDVVGHPAGRRSARCDRRRHHRGSEPRLDRRRDARRGGGGARHAGRVRPGGSCGSTSRSSTCASSPRGPSRLPPASVTVIFFALFGSLFVFTQYLQLVHGYSPLSAGVRALPFALATGAVSPLSPVLAKRLGNRTVDLGGTRAHGRRPALPVDRRGSPPAIPPWRSRSRSWEPAWGSSWRRRARRS